MPGCFSESRCGEKWPPASYTNKSWSSGAHARHDAERAPRLLHEPFEGRRPGRVVERHRAPGIFMALRTVSSTIVASPRPNAAFSAMLTSAAACAAGTGTASGASRPSTRRRGAGRPESWPQAANAPALSVFFIAALRSPKKVPAPSLRGLPGLALGMP